VYTNQVKFHYFERLTINKKTMALISAAHTDYQTIIIEESGPIYVNDQPLNFIEKASFKNTDTTYMKWLKKCKEGQHNICLLPISHYSSIVATIFPH